MDAKTKEFNTVDYQPPTVNSYEESTASWRVQPAQNANLGKAQGFTSVSQGVTDAQERHEKEKAPVKPLIVIALVLTAFLLFVASFFAFKACMADLNTEKYKYDSLYAATNNYSLIVVSDNNETPSDIWLSYVDTINERIEFAHINPNVSYYEDGAEFRTLSDVYLQRGLKGLMSALNSISGITLKAGVTVTSEQMQQIQLVMNSDVSHDIYGLVRSITSVPQEVDAVALQGLLRAMEDISRDNYAEFEAPYYTDQNEEETISLDRQKWISLVVGMRDITGKASSAE
ncbi:MAG: hypothetical protein IKE43_04815 [Coriobacteriales bacterium]|nr:hypothetical protein [Coriobacteriales bacterium]